MIIIYDIMIGYRDNLRDFFELVLQYELKLWFHTMHKNWYFPLNISSVNVVKSAILLWIFSNKFSIWKAVYAVHKFGFNITLWWSVKYRTWRRILASKCHAKKRFHSKINSYFSSDVLLAKKIQTKITFGNAFVKSVAANHVWRSSTLFRLVKRRVG